MVSFVRKRGFLAAACVVTFASIVFAFEVTRPPEIPFVKHTIDLGASETAAIVDINGDGKPDIVSGENWYEAPKWTRHHFRDLPFTNNYIDDFSDLPLDINGDGKIDVISVSWFRKMIAWYQNPGQTGKPWIEHT